MSITEVKWANMASDSTMTVNQFSNFKTSFQNTLWPGHRVVSGWKKPTCLWGSGYVCTCWNSAMEMSLSRSKENMIGETTDGMANNVIPSLLFYQINAEWLGGVATNDGWCFIVKDTKLFFPCRARRFATFRFSWSVPRVRSQSNNL